MNRVEYHLKELELAAEHVQEALQCLLHTIVFARWPHQKGPLRPQEIQCEHFPVAYASCGEAVVYRRIDDSIQTFMSSLVPAGPELLKGCLTLGFFYRRTNKVVFWAYEEKVVFEEWIIPLLVNNTPHLAVNAPITALERDRMQKSADAMYCRRPDAHDESTRTASLLDQMMEIFTQVNSSHDHVPPHHYDFEMSCSLRSEQREAFRTRVMATPLPVPV
uniref:Autophagy-related protein 101 n=1 Tax=Octactis speculum TaxID=3111310 RepID=A0A7S2BGI4_9STRA